MKKKIVSFAAVLMAMAMTTTSAFAVTPREPNAGDVDGSGKLTAGDAVMILNSANQGTEIEKGDFDGSWKTTHQKVTVADADRIMDYVLQPENKFNEAVGLRFYSISGIGSVAGTIANPLKNLELKNAENNKKYDNTYVGLDGELDADSNKTIVEVADQMVSLALTKEGTASKLAENLNKVYFHSDVKGDVYLTSKEGWAKLAYALKAINPVSPENCKLINKPVDENYNNDMDATTKARVDAFEKMGEIVTKNGAGNLTLTVDKDKNEVQELYSLAKQAFPGNGEISADQYKQAADDTYAIYSEKYGVSMETEKKGSFAVGQSSDDYFDVLVDLLRNYNTKTIQDVRDTFGDKISVTSGANTVVAELYAAATIK